MKTESDDYDPLETQEFFDLMQAYRHTSLASQPVVVRRFEEVKEFIREQISRPLATAKEFIAEHIGVEPDDAPPATRE